MAPPKDLQNLISLTKTTQTLLSHFQTSLASPPTTTPSTTTPQDLPTGPLPAIHAATTLLKSHTTTLSLLLLTPPLTPSALIAKIGEVSSGPLSGLVAAATYVPVSGARDDVGELMRGEVRTQVRRLVGAWGDVLGVVLGMAEGRRGLNGKDKGPSEAERRDVLERTGVVWSLCDEVVKLCQGGVVELVVKKAGQLRAVLMDAVEELKEWGEDIADDDEEDEDKAQASADEEENDFADDDDFFGARNKLRKSDAELKLLLDRSVKKLKMIGIMYQAVSKRRLKTFPATSTATLSTTATPTPTPTPTTATTTTTKPTPPETLNSLLGLLTLIPDTTDDLASTFYELEHAEAAASLSEVCSEAKRAVECVRLDWRGGEDEFTAWAGKWNEAFDAV